MGMLESAAFQFDAPDARVRQVGVLGADVSVRAKAILPDSDFRPWSEPVLVTNLDGAAADSRTEESESPAIQPVGGCSDLTTLKNIGPKRAERLKAEGIADVSQVASLNPERLANILKISNTQAMEIIKDALEVK